MGSVDPPALLDPQAVVEPLDQFEGGHDASGEEVAAQPVVLTLRLEAVRLIAMTEQVDEEASIRPEPPADPAQELPVVPHVLEHLDAHDAVEALVRVEIVHVRRDHPNVRRSPGLDEAPLRRGVRDRRDPAVWVGAGHVEGHRAPTATEL